MPSFNKPVKLLLVSPCRIRSNTFTQPKSLTIPRIWAMQVCFLKRESMVTQGGGKKSKSYHGANGDFNSSSTGNTSFLFGREALKFFHLNKIQHKNYSFRQRWCLPKITPPPSLLLLLVGNQQSRFNKKIIPPPSFSSPPCE